MKVRYTGGLGVRGAPQGGFISVHPGLEVEVDDANGDAVKVLRTWVDEGVAEVAETTSEPADTTAPTAATEPSEVPATATGPDGIIAWIAQADTAAERARRADLAEQAEDARGDDERVTVRSAIARARELDQEE